MRAALALCDLRGRFLFEARPDLFPEGYLTSDEIVLWGEYYDEKKKKKGRP